MKYFVAFSLLLLSLFANFGHSANLDYKIIIDAGSTGSRLHIFQVDKSTSVPSIQKVFSESIKPGLSAYADSPQDAGPKSLKILLDDAKVFLAEKRLKDTEIYILATAGMRLLPQEKQSQIYLELRKFLKQYPFQIQEIKTISGEMEGLYGWLDINYLLGHFKDHTPTVGSIDMGGASTQIAYATDDLTQANLISVDINQQHYHVLSKSFMGLGQEEALASVMQSKEAAACFPINYPYKETQRGFFNMQTCASIYSELIKKRKIEEEVALLPSQSFIAYSGIYYTLRFFEADGFTDKAKLETKVESLCNKDWDQLKQEYPEVPDKYKASFCAYAVFEYELLFNTYKLQPRKLNVCNQLAGQDLDWALGALLYRVL